MLDLYKMHNYRAAKATSTLVLGILFGAFLAINTALAAFVFGGYKFLLGNFAAESNFLDNTVYPATIHTFFVNTSDAFNVLITIFAVIFVHSDYSKGFIKNTYSLFEEKWKFVWAKWTALMTWVSCIFWGYSFLSVGLSAIFVSDFEAANFGDYLRVALVTYLGLIAFVTMIFLITSLFKSAAGGMVIGIIIASGLFQTIEAILDALIAKLSGADIEDLLYSAIGVGEEKYFKISEYCLDNVYLSYGASSTYADTVRSVLVFVVYTLLGLGLVMLFTRKRDIR